MDKLKLLLCKSVRCLLIRYQYLGRNSSIHGLKYAFEKKANPFKRLFWTITLVLSTGCLYLLLGRVVNVGLEVNFTPNTLYLHWDTIFPAVTVLESYNVKNAQKRLAARYPDLIKHLNYDYRRYMTDVVFGVGSCTRATCLPCGTTVPCDVPWRNIVNDIHKKCEELITDCSFNNKQFRCCDRFHPVDSEYGAGISFNSLQHTKFEQDTLFSVNRSTGPGVLTFRLLSDAQVSIHSPEELSTNFLDTKFKINVNLNDDVNILFSIVEVENDPLLQFETVNDRGCRYLNEIPQGLLHSYPVYSNGACRLASNTERSFQQCGCVHPARDISYKHLYCNYTGINCLVNYEGQKAKLGVDKDNNNNDGCLPSCVESELTIIHTSMRRVPKQANRRSLINIRMISLPTLRYRKNLLRNDLDLVVTVGGMLGLFFSASILSLVEAFYLILRTPNK